MFRQFGGTDETHGGMFGECAAQQGIQFREGRFGAGPGEIEAMGFQQAGTALGGFSGQGLQALFGAVATRGFEIAVAHQVADVAQPALAVVDGGGSAIGPALGVAPGAGAAGRDQGARAVGGPGGFHLGSPDEGGRHHHLGRGAEDLSV